MNYIDARRSRYSTCVECVQRPSCTWTMRETPLRPARKVSQPAMQLCE